LLGVANESLALGGNRLAGSRAVLLQRGTAEHDLAEQRLARLAGQNEAVVVLVGEDRGTCDEAGNSVRRSGLVAARVELALDAAGQLGRVGVFIVRGAGRARQWGDGSFRHCVGGSRVRRTGPGGSRRKPAGLNG